MDKKYIFILAEDGDVSVNDVIYWLKYIGALDVIRINNTDEILQININICSSNSGFTITTSNGVTVNSEQIHSYWYRRGELTYNRMYPDDGNEIADVALNTAMNAYHLKEWEHTIDYLHFLLRKMKIKRIGDYSDANTNKLICLEEARLLGFDIPKSIISNSIDEIRHFIVNNQKTITKAIRYPGRSFESEGHYNSFALPTTIYTIDDLNAFNDNKFQPTHFQEYIEKEFEVRTFYINKKTYSMAIFSQSNEKTATDFRNYDEDKPNRVVPFVLPEEIQNRTILLMEKLQYNTGSLDFIFDGSHFYFLEVNPVGQFGWLSKYCNYYIEHEIALELIK